MTTSEVPVDYREEREIGIGDDVDEADLEALHLVGGVDYANLQALYVVTAVVQADLEHVARVDPVRQADLPPLEVATKVVDGAGVKAEAIARRVVHEPVRKPAVCMVVRHANKADIQSVEVTATPVEDVDPQSADVEVWPGNLNRRDKASHHRRKAHAPKPILR